MPLTKIWNKQLLIQQSRPFQRDGFFAFRPMPQIHYFNPGHETAILLGTENYTPPANVQKMQKQLALLPAWYADPTDYLWAEEIVSPRFLSLQPKAFRPFAQPVTRNELNKLKTDVTQEVCPWGLSPHSLRLFNQLKQTYDLPWIVPAWKTEYVRLTSRQTAAECLEKIRRSLPDLLWPPVPKFCTKTEEIEKYLLLQNAPFVVKAPFSSSGRGLLWLHQRKLTEKDKNWIKGALHKQGSVSIECGLEKIQDFALEFFSDGQGAIRYEGLSVFGTEARGAYSGNILEHPEPMVKRLTRFVTEETFMQVREAVTQALRDIYASVYTGYLGVDMLIYKQKDGSYAIHPCVEINMRYTMGMVALRLFQKYLSPYAIGDFRISYEGSPGKAYQQHQFMKKAYPLKIENGKMTEGYLSLCPVTKDTQYRAYILIL